MGRKNTIDPQRLDVNSDALKKPPARRQRARLRQRRQQPKRLKRRPALTDEQQDLATSYLPMARALAKPLKYAWPIAIDEFESAACLALVEAAQSFDGSRNVKFATFARYRIWGALRDVQRDLIKAGWRDDLENAPRLVSLSSGMEEDGHILGSESDRSVEQEFEAVDSFEFWLRKLPKQHAEACRELYLNQKTQAEAAAAIGCSKSRLSYLHRESISMLNDAYRWKNPSGNRVDEDEFEEIGVVEGEVDPTRG